MRIKRNIRRAIALVFAFLLIAFLVSCSNKKSNVESVFREMVIETEETEPMVTQEYFTEHIYVIIPRSCSGELSLKAQELADKLKEKIGLPVTLKYDNELVAPPSNSCEILLGDTDRLASQNAMSILKSEDYLCRWDNGAIVICGRGEGATIEAIDKFLTDILPITSKYSIMPREAHFERIEKYDASSIILNGYDLYDYTITYRKGDGELACEIAGMLRDIINKKSGYLLETLEYDSLDKSAGKLIELIIDEKSEIAYTKTVEENLVLSAIDNYSLSMLASQFVARIFDNITDGVSRVEYNGLTEMELRDNSFCATYYTVNHMGENSLFSAIELGNAIEGHKSGFVFVTGLDDKTYELLMKNNNFDENYKIEPIDFVSEDIFLLYDTRTVKAVSYTLSENKMIFTASIETLFGERLEISYLMNATEEVTKSLMDKQLCSIAFLAGYDDSVSESEQTLALSGKATLDNGELEYLITANSFVDFSSDTVESVCDEYKFFCKINAKLNICKELMNYYTMP